MNILFFIDSLVSGGRERRMLELLFYLKEHTNYKLALVLAEHTIDYPYVHELNIPIHIIKRRVIKYDPSLFWRFYTIAKDFQPDVIHTWGTMTTWYAAPTKILLKCRLYANLIANAHYQAKTASFSNLFHQTAIKHADVILSNSYAGIDAYGLSNEPKCKVIYNGVRLNRFQFDLNLKKDRSDLQISTPFVVIMVASTSIRKDYDLLLDIAKLIAYKRSDITFLGVGYGDELERLYNRISTEKIVNLKLLGQRKDAEKLIAVSDIGLLFSPSEGISNSIIEYMALGKPVITTDTKGGSKEIIEEGKSGYIMQKNINSIAEKIEELLDNQELRNQLGSRGQEIIQEKFTIDRMGEEYVGLFENRKEHGMN